MGQSRQSDKIRLKKKFKKETELDYRKQQASHGKQRLGDVFHQRCSARTIAAAESRERSPPRTEQRREALRASIVHGKTSEGITELRSSMITLESLIAEFADLSEEPLGDDMLAMGVKTRLTNDIRADLLKPPPPRPSSGSSKTTSMGRPRAEP